MHKEVNKNFTRFFTPSLTLITGAFMLFKFSEQFDESGLYWTLMGMAILTVLISVFNLGMNTAVAIQEKEYKKKNQKNDSVV